MAKLTVTTMVTLDGVMQGPGGPSEDTSGGFTHGGWVTPHFDDDMGAFVTEVFSRADAFLLGRRTYEIFAAYWPKFTDESDPVASPLNRLPKHVVSRTLDSLEWSGSELVRDVPTEVELLKSRYERELQVHGSGKLVRTLIDNDLVDELNLNVIPVVLGTGERLFSNGIVPTGMKLLTHRVTKSGCVIATYRPTGKPSYGTVERPK